MARSATKWPGSVPGGWARPAGADVLQLGAYLYMAGFVAHFADHLARGLDRTPGPTIVAGTLASVGGVLAVALVLTRHRLGAQSAVVIGFGTALGFAAVHLPPHWSPFSQPFRGGVGALDWAAVLIGIAGAAAFGVAGLYAMKHERPNR